MPLLILIFYINKCAARHCSAKSEKALDASSLDSVFLQSQSSSNNSCPKCKNCTRCSPMNISLWLLHIELLLPEQQHLSSLKAFFFRELLQLRCSMLLALRLLSLSSDLPLVSTGILKVLRSLWLVAVFFTLYHRHKMRLRRKSSSFLAESAKCMHLQGTRWKRRLKVFISRVQSHLF